MSKQTPEELVAALDVARATLDAAWLNGKPIPAPSCIQAAARVIEAMGVECETGRRVIDYGDNCDTAECASQARKQTRSLNAYESARAATDEVIDLTDKKVEAPNE